MSQQPSLEVALTKCYYCGEGDRIVLNIRLHPGFAYQVKQMHGKVIDTAPCSKCEEWMKQGIILITIDDKKSGDGWSKPDLVEYKERGITKTYRPPPNPYRTGGFFVITEDAMNRLVHGDEIKSFAVLHRFMFIEHEAAEKLGLFTATPKLESTSDGSQSVADDPPPKV